MLGCMNVHPRGTADAAVVIRISGHRKGALCADCARAFAWGLTAIADGSAGPVGVGEIKVEPVPRSPS